jgi:hypothetical protein
MSNNWGDGRSWEEKNWDAVTRQEQKKQDLLVKASSNSERIRQMVRQADQTGGIARETLTTLDDQSGSPHPFPLPLLPAATQLSLGAKFRYAPSQPVCLAGWLRALRG